MTTKEKYHELCLTAPDIPIFSKDWWLDAVCGPDNWDVILIESGGGIKASWPYYKTTRHRLRMLTMPKLTQVLGPWIKFPAGQKNTTRLSYEKEILTQLIDRLPPFELFNQNFHYSCTNWLPFYWRGFQQTTRYTYVIDNLTDLERVFREFRENIKTDIRKAERTVTVEEMDDINLFHELNRFTFSKQNINQPHSLEFITKLDEACRKHDCRKMLVAKDSENRPHAAVYIVWDANSAYYLMGGGNPELRNSGATSLLLWEAIKFSVNVTNKFDFEGSMIEPIERFFRAFGAVQKPYFSITKTNSKIVKFLYMSKNLLQNNPRLIK